MRRLVIAATLVCAVALGATLARAEVAQEGTLRISFDGGFTPKSLPRDRPAPITVSVDGEISTTDGSHPPPLKRLQIELNRAGTISPQGLPSCSQSLLQSTSTEAALARCRPALVGGGSFEATLALGGAVPARGEALVFNGHSGSRHELLLHFYTSVPVRATLVLPLTIHRQAQGRYGTVLSTRIPTLAGGFGSITSLKLRIGREFSYRGERRGYIIAACAAPAGFPGASFPFARGNVIFAGGRTIHATLTRACKVS
jgi:hypothetical protein